MAKQNVIDRAELTIGDLFSLIPTDINECAMSLLGGCQQVCVNTMGGFQCECLAGFQLNLDNSTCSGNTV